MRSNVNSPWTEALIADLVRLWDHGYSCAQIGAIIGVTRNAVIGKAHRLDLPSRANNVNGQKRSINPRPSGSPRKGARPRICATIYKSRERKPANKIFNAPAKPGLMTVMSVVTGYPISIYGHKQPRLARQMTKTELRAMLTTAIQNTAAMESQA